MSAVDFVVAPVDATIHASVAGHVDRSVCEVYGGADYAGTGDFYLCDLGSPYWRNVNCHACLELVHA